MEKDYGEKGLVVVGDNMSSTEEIISFQVKLQSVLE